MLLTFLSYLLALESSIIACHFIRLFTLHNSCEKERIGSPSNQIQQRLKTWWPLSSLRQYTGFYAVSCKIDFFCSRTLDWPSLSLFFSFFFFSPEVCFCSNHFWGCRWFSELPQTKLFLFCDGKRKRKRKWLQDRGKGNLTKLRRRRRKRKRKVISFAFAGKEYHRLFMPSLLDLNHPSQLPFHNYWFLLCFFSNSAFLGWHNCDHSIWVTSCSKGTYFISHWSKTCGV